METRLKVGEVQTEQTELIVLGVFEDQSLGKSAAVVDQVLGGQISQVMADGDFKGKARELTLLYSAGRGSAKRILLVGLGKVSKHTTESIRVAAGTAAKRVRELGVNKFQYRGLRGGPGQCKPG